MIPAMRALVLLISTAASAGVTRGPYLQLASPTGITIVFRTDAPAIGQVRYGASPASLTSTVADQLPTTEHVLRLTGLTPSTRYWYAVDVDGLPVMSGDDYRFRTYPTPGTQEAFRIFAWGDSGNGSAGQFAVAQRMATQLGDATLSLILGDIIYDNGEPSNYDPRFFEPYAPLLRRMVIWPTIGNHDVGLDPTGGPYLDAYYLPTNNPARTELYYSFDYGDAHFVCLDTHVNSYAAGSAQLQWAAADLAASTARWKFVFFHVPPYSGGTHADDVGVRDNILPVLEAAGADVVFSGHSHVYERTWLLKNHAIVQSDRASYVKASPLDGTIYVVSGTAGQSGSLSDSNHPLMAFQQGNVLGTSVIDVAGDTLHGYFLRDDGNVLDLFRLVKGADREAPRIIAARATAPDTVELSFDEPVLAAAAQTATNYVISPSVAVSAARLRNDQRSVVLTTAPHAPGAYSVSVSNVGDRASPRNTVAPGTRAAYSVSTTSPLLAGAAQWRYLVGASAPPAAWTQQTFVDSAWAQGAQPLGYGEPALATTVNMGSALTLYARTSFNLAADPFTVRELALDLDFDDGFVAYLNGVEISRDLVAPAQTFASPATAAHESGTAQRYLVRNATSVLRQGDNVLAIEVHNVDVTSSDLFLRAGLWATTVPAPPLDGGIDGGEADDAGAPDAGASVDAGSADSGIADAGLDDAGTTSDGGGDAGTGPLVDAGTGGTDKPVGCGCSTSDLGFPLSFLALAWRRRRGTPAV